MSIPFKSRVRFRPPSREPEQQFSPTPEEWDFINRFGNDRTVFNTVMEILEGSGLPQERTNEVWKMIREQRRINLGQVGKERSG